MSKILYPKNTNCPNLNNDKTVFKSIGSDGYKFITFSNQMFGDLEAIQYLSDNKVWFILDQISSRLGYSKPDKAARLVSHKHLSTESVPVKGTNKRYKKTIISSPGVHELLGRSHKPSTQPFRDWMYGTVMESVRTTGKYEDTFNDYSINMHNLMYDHRTVTNCYANSNINVANIQHDEAASRNLRNMATENRNKLTSTLRDVFDINDYKNMTDMVYYELFGHTAKELKEMIYIKDNNIGYENANLLRTHFNPEVLSFIAHIEEGLFLLFKAKGSLTPVDIRGVSMQFGSKYNPKYILSLSSGYQIIPMFQLPFRSDTIINTSRIDIEKGLPYNALYERYFNLRY